MMKIEVSSFDISEYLDDDETIFQFLNNALEEGNVEELITAIGYVAKARGMTKIAADTGMSRPSLYKALSQGSKPQFETIVKVIKALGGNLSIKFG